MAMNKEQFDSILRSRASNVDTSTTYELNEEAYSKEYNADSYLTIVKEQLDGESHETVEFQIHVFPDQRPILLQAMFNFKDMNDNLIRAHQANVSKASFIAYVMCQWNVFMYFNDRYRCNGPPSSHTRVYDNDPDRRAFVDEMSALPIPDFLALAFTTLTTSTLPRRKNIRFSMSAKGFLHDYDFGRFFPIAIFLDIHNLIANRKPEDNKQEFWNDVFTNLLYTLDGQQKCIGNFFGVLPHANGTSRFINSPLFQYLNSYFKDIFSQDVHKRRIYQSLPLQPLVFVGTPNYYDMIFSFSNKNVHIYKQIFRDTAGLMKSYNFGSNTIQSIIFSQDNLKIFAPAYMELTPPTWSYPDVVDVNKLKPMSRTEMSLALNFKIKPDPSKMTRYHGMKTWTATCTAEHEVTVEEDEPIPVEERTSPDVTTRKVTKTKKQETTENATFSGSLTNYTRSHKSKVTYPPLSEFRVYGNDYKEPGAIVDRPLQLVDFTPTMPYMAGLFIENDEIDGMAVPIPNPDGINAIENSYFLCSAMPVQLFYDATQTMPIYSRKRVDRHDDTGIYSGLIQGDRSKFHRNILSSQYGVLDPCPNPEHTNIANLNPGMTQKEVTWIGKEASIISAQILSPMGDNINEASYPNVNHNDTKYKIPGWSCYRYVVDERFDPVSGHIQDFSYRYYYFLMNLRTIFGAQVDTRKLKNFFECIPNM